MKKTYKLAVCLAMTLSFAAVSQAAEEKKWEIWTGSLADVNFGFGGTTTVTNINVAGLQGLNPTIGYILTPGIEIVLTPTFLFQSATTSQTTLIPRLGINYSFMSPMEDSFYIQATAGISLSATTTTTTSFIWEAQLGKRFKLFEGVTYAPAVKFNMATSTPSSSNLAIVPAQFSFLM